MDGTVCEERAREAQERRIRRTGRAEVDPRSSEEGHSLVVVATLAAECLDAATLKAAINGAKLRPDYVVNIPIRSMVLGDAIQLGRKEGVGVGHFKDLLGALASSDVSRHVSSDVRYVEENLPQHDRVKSIQPLADRHYRIERHDLPAVQVVFINEYDLTVDHVRTGQAALQILRRHRDYKSQRARNGRGRTARCHHELSCLRLEDLYGALNRKLV